MSRPGDSGPSAPQGLGGLFAGGMPKLKPAGSGPTKGLLLLFANLITQSQDPIRPSTIQVLWKDRKLNLILDLI